jgi:E3 ubiquitin-protein ligase DMA1/2
VDGPTEHPEPTREPHEEAGAETTEAVDTFLHAEGEESEPDRIEHSDGAEASDASNQEANQVAEDLGYMNIEESPSPLSSTDSQPNQISNSTVPPVDISRPRGTHLEQPDPRMGRSRSRTPSPNGMPSSLSDVLAGTEGPMTPRNDAGPFVFDGSAGRPSDVRLASITSVNLGAAADIPSPRSTPQPQPAS